MRRRASIFLGAVLLALALLLLHRRPPTDLPSHTPARNDPSTAPPPATAAARNGGADDTTPAEAVKEVVELHGTLANFLIAMKEPRHFALGDNIDITRALTGGNGYGTAYIASNDARVDHGRLVDRWGTPYHFHPRAPDAIDVRSAGPDRTLFTPDDILYPPHAPPPPASL